MENIWIERLWRSLKQEAVYLEELTDDGFKAHRVIRSWMTFHNTERPVLPLSAGRPRSVLARSRSEIGGTKPKPDTP